MSKKESSTKAVKAGFGGGADRGLAPGGLFLTAGDDGTCIEIASQAPLSARHGNVYGTASTSGLSEQSSLTEFPSIRSATVATTLPELRKTLVNPLGLKHRALTLSEEQEKELVRLKQYGKTGPQRKTIEERLKGLPGGLALNTEETQKYFGEGGREKFFGRYQWMNQQMQITSKNSTETVDKLLFSESNAKQGKKDESGGRPFGASRASSRAKDKAVRTAMRTSGGQPAISVLAGCTLMDSTIATRDSDMDGDSFVSGLIPRDGGGFGAPLGMTSNTFGGGDDISILSNDGDNFSIGTVNTAELPALRLNSPTGTHCRRLGTGPAEGATSPLQNNAFSMEDDNMSLGMEEVGGLGTMSGAGGTSATITAASAAAEATAGVASGSRSRTGKSLASHNFFTSLDDDLSESDDSADDEFYSGTIRNDTDMAMPTSPRSRYIAQCLQKATNPRASLLVRKNFGKSLELHHHGIGDKMAEIWAKSIVDIPFVQSINLEDNNLTDKGLGPILLALVQIEGLLELNLSQNVIGTNTAECLAAYLANPKCPLERLVLTKADIDDFECERFLAAIKGNKVLTELDLSNNLLGSAENLNTVMPDLITAGEALAELLRENLCVLETLKLGWNMLRLDGAIELAQSLASNRTLTYLDLSYNSLGHDGGMALGASIIENKMLETLLVENNGLDAAAALTLCAGVIENRGLKRLAMDGNPIGVVGAKSLMLVPTIAGQRVKVSARRCNVTIRDERCWFEFDKMLRVYTMDMEHPYHRAITLLMLHFVASHRSYVFEYFDYEEVPRAGKVPIPLVQGRSTEPEKFLDDAQKKVVQNLRRIQKAAENVDDAITLFHEIDVDGSGELDNEELNGLLVSLGLNLDEERIDDIIRAYDIDGGGTIGMDEFLYFLKEQNKEAKSRITDILKAPIMMLQGSKENVPYKPPLTGRLHFEIADGFQVKEIHRTLSSVDRDYINDVAKDTGDAMVTMTTNGVEGFKVRLDEGLNLYKTMMVESRNKILVIAKLLPQMSSQADARELVTKALHNDMSEMLRLKRNIGPGLGPMLSTVPTGFYQLDLKKKFDRLCLERLIELSATIAVRRRALSPLAGSHIGDVSQKMNYMSFRNETFNGKRVDVDMRFGRPLPKAGHLCFDFSCENDAPEDALMMSDETMVKVLEHNFLLRKEDEHIALMKMRRWTRQANKATGGNAVSVYEAGWKRAKEMGLAQSEFDVNLELRSEELLEAMGREEIKVTYDNGGDPPADSPAAALKKEDVVVEGTSGMATNTTRAELRLERQDEEDDHSVVSNASSTDGEKSEAHEGDVEDEFGLVDGAEDAFEAPEGVTEDPDGHTHTHHSHSHHRMMRKLHILLMSKKVGKESKAVRLAELLEEVLLHVWIRCRHLALLMECFKKFGSVKKAVHFGSYRTELAVSLFSRVIDPHNFELVMRVLEPYEAGCLVSRIGLLNIFNPMKPEGCWELDLGRYEERVVAKTMAALSVVEPGDNWLQKAFMWARDLDPMPGWELVTTWMNEEGFPRRGIITVEYYAGGGTFLRECRPDIKFRKALMQLCSVNEECMRPEEQDKLAPEELVGEKYLKDYSDMWYTLLISKEK
jgi:hypothetical protein